MVGHVVSPFDLSPNSSRWWWLISSMFLTRSSCGKTTHAIGYYGAWPGWAVSSSGLPLTLFPFELIQGLVLVAQLCPTLCDSMEYSPPASSVHGSLQARLLQWVARDLLDSGTWADRTWASRIAGGFFTV